MTQWHKMGMQAFIAKEIMRKDTLPFAIGMGCAAPRPRTARRPRDRPPFAASSPSWASTSTPASPVRGRRPASSARARPADARSLTPRAPLAAADKKDSAYYKQFVLNERSGH